MTNAQVIQLFLDSAHQAWLAELQAQPEIRARRRSVALAAKSGSGDRSNCKKKKG